MSQRPNSLPLPFFGKVVELFGGPYYQRPPGTFGVKLAVEINEPCDLNLPIPDYSVPNVKALDAVLTLACNALSGAPDAKLYAGCMGGKGRTGLFLACFAQAWGILQPVEYVRRNYNSHAVETKEQYQFVTDFKPSWKLRRAVWTLKAKTLFRPI